MNRELLKYTTLDSTNNEALRLLRAGKITSRGYIVSDYQEQGRGQRKNSWHAEPGEGMLLSAVLFPEFLSVSSQFALSKAVSVAVLKTLGAHQINASIKWPNDILVESKKIGGILIELSIMGNHIKHAIAGVGLNVNNTCFPDFDRPATSMKLVSGKQYEVDRMTEHFIINLESEYDRVKKGDVQHVNQEYLDNLYKLGEKAQFQDGQQQFEGVINGVSAEGELLVDVDGETQQYPFHAIKMLT